MPRRSSTRTTITIEDPPHHSPPPPLPVVLFPEDVVKLRTQWKWAAFSQFFFTFSHILAMNDVTLTDIENDLTRGRNTVLPRIMQRLLYTLSYDRKVSLDNWQTALRKQYRKRDPLANPIGPEPSAGSPEPRFASAEQDSLVSNFESEPKLEGEDGEGPSEASVLLPKVETPRSTSQSIAGDDVTFASQGRRDTTHVSSPEPAREFGAIMVEEVDQRPTKDWLGLSMLEKLNSMHLLAEWQFQNPMRLRTLMKNDDEIASWRIEPIGYDSKRNAYWLIGDRLWIQRVVPKPPRTLKRKRPTDTESNGIASKSKRRATPAKRPRLQPEQTAAKQQKSKGGKASDSPPEGRGSRAAKAQANMKLDAQARELAELNKEAVVLARGTTGARSSRRQTVQQLSLSRPLGTRLSTRLRGRQDDEWQSVPDEWLSEGANGASRSEEAGGGGSGGISNLLRKTGLESDADSISDLTELSDEIEDKEVTAVSKQTSEADDAEEEAPVVALEGASIGNDWGLEEPPILPPEGFIEWETICVTLYEWEHIAERFEKATHYTEKALFKVLANEVVPNVTESLKEIDRKKRLEEALVQRKRSSRIAIKESEKEEARASARKRAEEDEKMSRARRLEVRLQKEEADRARREAAREQRRTEREEKEALQKKKDGESSEVHMDVIEGDRGRAGVSHHMSSQQGKLRFNRNPMNGTGSGSRTPLGEDWELDCEICHRRGINTDDGTPMMSCGICSKWQHIICHDRADQHAGLPKRNWDVVEFICQQCRSRMNTTHMGLTPGDYRQPQQASRPSLPHPQAPLRAPYNQYIPPDAHLVHRQDGYMGARNYPNQVNGNSAYAVQQLSSVRSPAIPPTHTQIHSHQQFYTPPHPMIAISHYQPEQRRFSSSSQISQSHHASGSMHPYSHHPTTSYPAPGTNGQPARSYQQALPRAQTQATWDITTPAHMPGYSPICNASSERSSAANHPDSQYSGISTNLQTQWQSHARPVEPSPQNNFPTTQFRYHPTSYQAPH